MELASQVLEHEHREIDDGLAEFREGLESGSWNRRAFASAAGELRDHIYVEEVVLFPWLRQGGLVAPIMVMLREHGEIWRALDELEQLIDSAQDVEAAKAAYDRLVGVIEVHNSKEEAILYRATDQVLDGEQAETLRKALDNAAADRPADWVCQAVATGR